MARVIEKPNELVIKCPHCGAKIGFDKSDVVVDTLWSPIDEKMEPIITRELTCPYCRKIIYLEKDYDK